MSTANIAAKDVMTLRQKTGLGMMDCKKALIETDGDMTAAETALRTKLKGKMDARTDRAAGEGSITICIGDSSAAIIEVRAETDFTARNDEFVAMVNKLAEMALEQGAGDVAFTDDMRTCLDDVRIKTGENISFARGVVIDGSSFGKYVHHDGKLGVLVLFEGEPPADVALGVSQHVAAHVPTPMAVDESGIQPEIIESKRNEAAQEAIDTGKPAEIAEKIAQGKMRKFLEEVTLLGQKFVRDDKKTVSDILPDGVTVKHFVRMRVGQST